MRRGMAAAILRRQCLVGGKRGGPVPNQQEKRSGFFLGRLEQPQPCRVILALAAPTDPKPCPPSAGSSSAGCEKAQHGGAV